MPEGMYMHCMYARAHGVQKRLWIPCNWSYRWGLAITRVLGTEPGTSASAPVLYTWL